MWAGQDHGVFCSLLQSAIISKRDNQQNMYSTKLSRLFAQVKPLEHAIRFHWRRDVFLAGSKERADAKDASRPWYTTITSDSSDYNGVTIAAVNLAVTSDSFWARLSIVCDVATEADFIGFWSEGCPCHNDSENAVIHAHAVKRRRIEHGGRGFASSCPYRGCRAPELACGISKTLHAQAMAKHRDNSLLHYASLPQDQRVEFLEDLDSARSRLWSYLTSYVLLSAHACWMDGWMDGWVGGWVGGSWLAGWMDGWMGGWVGRSNGKGQLTSS